MPDHLGGDMRKVRVEEKEEEIKCEFCWIVSRVLLSEGFELANNFEFSLPYSALDEGDIELLKTYVSV